MPFFGGGTGDYRIVGTNIKGGTQAMPAVIGDNNMALGNGAGQSAENADGNIFIGNASAINNVDGGNNVVVGQYAASGLFTALTYSTIIGAYCFAHTTAVSSITSSVILGAIDNEFGDTDATIDNSVLISPRVFPGGVLSLSDSIVLGNTLDSDVLLTGSFAGSIVIGLSGDNGQYVNSVVIGNNTTNSEITGNALNVVSIGAGNTFDENAIVIGSGLIATANQIVIGDSSHTSILIGGIDFSAIATGTFPELIVGDPGTEGGGIDVNGVTYDSTLKVSDIDGTNFAQTILHRHSTILEPLIVGARSNSDTNAHASVVNGMGLFSVYATGWAGANYKIFGTETFGADDTGTISNTSAPGKWTLSLTPDGGVAPAAVITARNDKSVEFAGGVKFASVTFATLPAAATRNGKIYFVSDIGVNGSYWYSNGTRWVLLNHTATLKSDSTVYTGADNTNEQILAQFTFPAGFFKVGDVFRVVDYIERSNVADAVTRRIRLGTSGTVADTVLIDNGQPSGANLLLVEEQYFSITNATACLVLGNTSVTWNGISPASGLTRTISNISNSLILSLTLQKAAATGTVAQVKHFEVDYDSCGA